MQTKVRIYQFADTWSEYDAAPGIECQDGRWKEHNAANVEITTFPPHFPRPDPLLADLAGAVEA